MLQHEISSEPTSSVFIQFDAAVLQNIRRHARTSMDAEICGVLLGKEADRKTIVDGSIAGEQAGQGSSHVTFTQDTWAHIYRVKDREYPEKKIVGWYHSHPGFGVFLSEHDTFIHKNFFSVRHQVAWVFDPRSDEEGCFGWSDGNIRRVSRFHVVTQTKETEPRPEPAPMATESAPVETGMRPIWHRILNRWECAIFCALIVMILVILVMLALNVLQIHRGISQSDIRLLEKGIESRGDSAGKANEAMKTASPDETQ